MQKKRHNGHAPNKTSVEDEIVHLRGLDLKGLRARWAATQNAELRLQVRSDSYPSPAAGNGIFGCRDRPSKISTKMGERSQRQKSGKEWSEIPAETHYLASCRKRVVFKDWMVEILQSIDSVHRAMDLRERRY